MAKIEKMSREDLAREKAEAEKRLAELRRAESEYDDRRKKELKAQIEAMLKEEGYSAADLFGAKAAKKQSAGKPKGTPKYRHPENPDLTWSGRGRQPQWYKDHIEAGGNPQALAV
jgi:DNA-binding protein H-NS